MTETTQKFELKNPKKQSNQVKAIEEETTMINKNNISNQNLVNQTKNIFQIYFNGWKKILSIKGRASPSEFISFWSLSLPLFFLLNPIYETSWINIILICLSLVVLTALFTLNIRRFHDIGYPTSLSIIIFLFIFGLLNIEASTSSSYTICYIIGVFLYFIMGTCPGQKKENKFGLPPQKASKTALVITCFLSLFLIRSIIRLGMILYDQIYLYI